MMINAKIVAISENNKALLLRVDLNSDLFSNPLKQYLRIRNPIPTELRSI